MRRHVETQNTVRLVNVSPDQDGIADHIVLYMPMSFNEGASLALKHMAKTPKTALACRSQTQPITGQAHTSASAIFFSTPNLWPAHTLDVKATKAQR